MLLLHGPVEKLGVARCRVDGCVAVVGFATPHTPVLTGIAACLTRVLGSLTLTYMLTLDRDRQIVMSVARFGQLTAGHLRSMLFSQLSSQTPLDRALKRLVERRYLARIERRMVGGTGAGSGQYVYQLGSQGWLLAGKTGRYWPFRAINYHSLAIADVYTELLRLQADRRITMLDFLTEPETWVEIGGADIRPDLRVDLTDRFNGRELSLWVEVDMGTERVSVIRQKLAMYWHAYQHSDDSKVFPQILFIAPDRERAKQLRYTIEQGAEEAQPLFVVSTVDKFGGRYFS